jgi:NAD(P)-dependent dehydrogenase (short-subunit alcohol dehydrogenase family)
MAFGVTTSDFPSDGCAIVFGASGGLGQATAGLLAERGANVVATYHSRPDPVNAVVKEIHKMDRRASAMECDVTKRASIDKVVNAAIKEYGRIHTVVSAGGLVFRTSPLVDFKDDEFRGVIETDVFGFFNISKAVVPALRDGGGGSITALITCAVSRIVPEDSLSAVPKAAVWMLVRQLAAEEARNGIRANAVGPGVVNGGMVIPMLKGPTKKVLDMAVEATPLHRMAECAEIAEALAFLASSKAAYVTGQFLMVDGGLAI